MRHLFNPHALALAESIVRRLADAGYPGAVVAGGFLRDAALGVAPKDLDVFLPAFPRPLPSNLERSLSDALGVNLQLQCDLSYGEDCEIGLVLTEQPPSSLPIQVIEMAPGIVPKTRVARHDFGLCQASVDIDGLKVTKEFLTDLTNRTCTLVHCEDSHQHARSMRRWERWKANHAVLKDYRLVDNTGLGAPL